MASSFVLAVGVVRRAQRRGAALTHHLALIATVAITTVVWLAATWLTPPTDRDVLRTLLSHRAAGRAGLGRDSARVGRACPSDDLKLAFVGWLAGCAFVYSALFGSWTFPDGEPHGGSCLDGNRPRQRRHARARASSCSGRRDCRRAGARRGPADAPARRCRRTLSAAQAEAASAGRKAMMPLGRRRRSPLSRLRAGIASCGRCDRVCLVVAPDHDDVRRRYSRIDPPRSLRVDFVEQPTASARRRRCWPPRRSSATRRSW